MNLPVVSLDIYLSDPSDPAALAEAQKAAESLILNGAVIVKDARAPKEANDRFLDLLEDYFQQEEAALKEDERPELGYQVVSSKPKHSDRCPSHRPSGRCGDSGLTAGVRE
jgi:hypothetical protein